MVFLSFSLTAFGMSYMELKKHTLKHAKVLQSQALLVQQRQKENDITLRTPNPTLELEAGYYNPDFEDSGYGYKIAASQQVRTSSYFDALQRKTDAQIQLSKAYMKEHKAKYIKLLEDTYTEYVYQSKMLTLLKEELTLSSKMTRIAKERYENGSESKVSYLQAKTQALSFKTQLHTTKQQIHTLYYKLLALAGISKNVSLRKRFIYAISNKTKYRNSNNVKEKILLAKERLYANELRMHKDTLTHYEIVTGIEKEPDQSILRFGVSFPLPLQHNKQEERALSRLKLQQLKLDRQQLSLDMKSQKQIITSSISELSQQYHALKVLKKEQQKLTKLLTEGYRIAQRSLLELILAKNRLIQTKKSLLFTQKEINHQKIALRLLQGAYND